MRAALVGLVVLTLAAVAAWAFGGWSEPGAPQTTSVPPVVAPASADAGPAATAVPAAAEAQRAAAVPAATAVAANPLPADGAAVTVRVLDAMTNAPVAGAEVLWVTGDYWKRLANLPPAEARRLGDDAEAMLRATGWRTVADAGGLARIVLDAKGGILVGLASGRYALRSVAGDEPSPPGGFELLLEPDQTLQARVQDVAGLPVAGVEVAAQGRSTTGEPTWVPGATAAPSDGEGLVRWRHVQLWSKGGQGRMGRAVTAVLTLRVPGLEDFAVPIDLADLPKQPVPLVMPSTGRLVATLRHRGQLLRQGVKFAVWRGGTADPNASNRAPSATPGPDGQAVFPHVGLGGELTVAAMQGQAEVITTIQAPVAVGQEVRVELDTAGHIVLVGRLLDAAMQPIRSSHVMTDFDFSITMGNGSVATDDDGRFLWLLPKGRESAELKKLVFTQRPDGQTAVRCDVAPRSLLVGENDLGVLQLDAGALVVAGQVVADPPLQQGAFWLQIEAPGERRQRDGSERWRRVDKLTISQLDGGAFEVRGVVAPGRYRVRVQSQGLLPVQPVEFVAGAKDLRIAVVMGHGLRATALVDQELPLHTLQAVLLPRFTPPAEAVAEAFAGHRADSRYHAEGHGAEGMWRMVWQGLPPGTYDLELAVQGSSVPLLRLEGVVVPTPAGGDPRLDAFDLRGKVRLTNLEVRFPGEAPERGAVMVFPQPTPDPQAWQGQIWLPGVPLPLGPEVREVLVVADGYRPERLEVTGEPLTATLQPWPSLELTFAGLPPLPAGVRLLVSARFDEPSSQPAATYRTAGRSGSLASLLQPSSRPAEVRDGRAQIPVGEGQFQLVAYLLREGARRPAMVRGIAPATLVVGRDLTPVAVQLPAAELQAAMAEIATGAR